MRRTKIVVTIGPASNDPEVMKRFINDGVDVFRLNFSHGDKEDHRHLIKLIRSICLESGRDVAIMQDLSGPKIRVGSVSKGAIKLNPGSEIVIESQDIEGTESCIGVNYDTFAHDVKEGDRVLLDDGTLELVALSITDNKVRCRVLRGGILKSHKGVNLPNTTISAPSITAKDLDDLSVGIEEGVDFVALSFVRSPDDIAGVRKILEKHNSPAQIIAKIERPEAIRHIDAIVAAADGVLVARGDLGVEMDIVQVALLQKSIVRAANEQDKYVIVATQMLESMIHSPVPTRAEVSDVTNAVIDGADAVMLSGETAVGEFPVESVEIVKRILCETESYLITHQPKWDWKRLNAVHPLQDAIGHAVFSLYDDLSPGAIVAFSATGGTALFLSKSRPFAPIIVFTNRHDALRRMRLFWGVEPVYDNNVKSKDQLVAAARNYLGKEKNVGDGKQLLVVCGSHFGEVGTTNTIEVVSVN